MNRDFDIAIIGAGMAGASLAAEIGSRAKVVILEAEHMPGYHATGRSAAFWEQCYGGPEIVPLTLASGSYLREHGFLARRGALYLARKQDQSAIDAFLQRFKSTPAQFEVIGRERLETKIPALKSPWERAIWQPDCSDIDVAQLHQHYLKRALQSGATLRCKARVTEITRDNGWRISLADGASLRCKIVANAAGAWVDDIAGMAGVLPLGIEPFRRTVVQLRVDCPLPSRMPLCLDISGQYYFKPDNGRLWLSPHDETPSLAMDVAPDEVDIAVAIERLKQVTDWRIEAVERKWAGLRSFAPDRRPVYGFDPQAADFFWFAGQGGFGIQTAPAAARLGAQLMFNMPRDAMTRQLDAEIYSPERLR